MGRVSAPGLGLRLAMALPNRLTKPQTQRDHFSVKRLFLLLFAACALSRFVQGTSCSNWSETVSHIPEDLNCTAEKKGQLRIRGTESTAVGRLEVCDGTVWGVVCANHWKSEEAAVACRQLDYESSHAIDPAVLKLWKKAGNYTAEGSRKSIWDHTYCTGKETRLENCFSGHTRQSKLHENYGRGQRDCYCQTQVGGVNCTRRPTITAKPTTESSAPQKHDPTNARPRDGSTKTADTTEYKNTPPPTPNLTIERSGTSKDPGITLRSTGDRGLNNTTTETVTTDLHHHHISTDSRTSGDTSSPKTSYLVPLIIVVVFSSLLLVYAVYISRFVWKQRAYKKKLELQIALLEATKRQTLILKTNSNSTAAPETILVTPDNSNYAPTTIPNQTHHTPSNVGATVVEGDYAALNPIAPFWASKSYKLKPSPELDSEDMELGPYASTAANGPHSTAHVHPCGHDTAVSGSTDVASSEWDEFEDQKEGADVQETHTTLYSQPSIRRKTETKTSVAETKDDDSADEEAPPIPEKVWQNNQEVTIYSQPSIHKKVKSNDDSVSELEDDLVAENAPPIPEKYFE